MEPSRSRLPQPSGTLRLSRLPVLRSTNKPPNHGEELQLGSNRKHGDGQSTQTIGSTFGSTPQKPRDNTGVETSSTDVDANHNASLRQRELSLSDRTAETLSQIPPTPSPRRRRSSFFPAETPTRTPSRPTSSLAQLRPGTSHGRSRAFRASEIGSRPGSPEKRQLVPTSGNISPQKTPAKATRDSSAPHNITRPSSRLDSTPGKFASRFVSTRETLHLNGSKIDTALHSNYSRLDGSKTFAGRSKRVLPSAREVFAETPEPCGTKGGTAKPSNRKTVHPSIFEKPSKTPLSAFNGEDEVKSNSSMNADPAKRTASPNSSALLREKIAKAKAERAKILRSPRGDELLQSGDAWISYDFVSENKGLLKKRIATARNDGRLNIAAMGLEEFPLEVKNMYSANNSENGNWFESVDLVRLIAADNSIEVLDQTLFPDTSLGDDDDHLGNIFGMLETIDLHGNQIKSLPLGLRRLQNLTSLNLSKNRLDGDVFSVLSEIKSLKELRLAENHLQGTLDDQLFELNILEILDVRSCGISAISTKLQHLGALRTLNLAGNQLENLPFETLSLLPLIDLDVSHNRLGGCLMPSKIDKLPHLKSLDVSFNSLTSLCDGKLETPSLRFLHVAENRLQQLPDLSSCTELITMTASGNQIGSIPEGLSSLQSLKNADFARNDLKKLDERLGLLEGLTVLSVANNPLRDRKFLTMNTEDLKRELQSRFQPNEGREGELSIAGASSEVRANHGWEFRPGGILERRKPIISDLAELEMDELAMGETIKSLVLRQNIFQQIPLSVGRIASTLTSLDLSHNRLHETSYLPVRISLPKLKSLDLSHNTVTSLQPVLDHLSAPLLSELKISRNHLTTLPELRHFYPHLSTVLAADNKLKMLPVAVVEGLEVLDASGNEIEHLDPRLGLLEAQGLRTLLVTANTFRVPRRDMLEKGTGAILAWLRGRIPDHEED